MTAKVERCCCCGQPLPIFPRRTMKRRILKVVKEAGARGISSDDLFKELYDADSEGGPLSGKKAMYVLINQLNKNLKAKGLRVRAPVTGGGRSQRYTLVTL